jgi:putative ABC transport system permease protein
MFRSYLKIAYRNFFRHKAFSLINIAGLSLGLTACLLIGLFVYDELQYDRFIPEGDRVYRIYNDLTNTEGREIMASTPPMFAVALQQNFPEVETTVRVLNIFAKDLVEAGNKKLYAAGGIVADSTFFEIFPLRFLSGSPEKALSDPTSIVISDKFAASLFGKADPVGKAVAVNKQRFLVKGVFASNRKFHLPVHFILPMASAGISSQNMRSWSWQQFYTYAKLKEGADVPALQARFQATIQDRVHPETKKNNFHYLPYLQPLREVYLHSASFKFDIATKGNITYIRALSIIAVFILIIACFNFVNLATARSMQRAREVGVRKAIGASRSQLMLQFLVETALLTLISVIYAAALTSLALPALNAFTGKQIAFKVFTAPAIPLILLGLTVLVGLLAGFYPALILSGSKPVSALQGAVANTGKTGTIPWLRHGLIVIQFALSIFLIISAFIVFRQVSFLHNKDLGFNKEQIMFFPMRGEHMTRNYETFKNELLQAGGITHASIGYGFPGDAVAGDIIIVPKAGKQIPYSVTQLMVDFDYLSTLQVQVVAGRAFSRDFKTDADQAFMINETAVRELGYGSPQKALGQPLRWKTWDQAKPDSLRTGKIIGVVQDFHYKSLYDRVEPTVLLIYPDAFWKVAVKMKAADVAQAIAHVKQVWNRFAPDYPLEYVFMDENFEQMYRAEDKLKSLLGLFTAVAIFIACLGLFGLAAYAAERRKKEIGIRRVLGADTATIVALLAKEFLLLIFAAALLSFPLAWYAMHQWLQGFAYRIQMPVWVFLAAAGTAVVLALITISYQAIKAATANPVTSLKTE